MEQIYLETASVEAKSATIQVIGSSLVASAMESLLAKQPDYVVVRDAGQIVLLIGQYGMDVARKLRMHKSRKRREQFVLIADGTPIDFSLVRDVPINAFVASEESVTVLLEALRAAASGSAFCSAQMVPILVGSSAVSATEQISHSAPARSHGLLSVARDVSLRATDETESEATPISARHTTNGVAPFATPSDILASAGRMAIALGLTEREWEVAALAVEGLTNFEISGHTSLSIPSVKFLLYRAYQKLGIRRRAQLAAALMIIPAESVTFAAYRKRLAQDQASPPDTVAAAS